MRTKYLTTTDGHLIKMEKESDEEEGSVHSYSQSFGRHHHDDDELSPNGFSSPPSSSGCRSTGRARKYRHPVGSYP